MSIKSLEFHIESNDYFGTLATVLSIFDQSTKNKEIELKTIIEDLLYLQNEYKIVKNNN
jgi:hypothetical protein